MSEKYKWGVLIFIVISLFSIHFYGRSETVTDTTPPVTTIEFAGPIYEKDGKQWIGSQTSIWLNATDNFKVKYLYYEIWKDSDNDGVFETLVESRKVYDSSAYDKNPALGKISVEIKINEECYHKIIYYSSDYAGNIEYYGVVLNEEWRYEFEFNVVHTPDNVIFGSSPAIANLSGDENLEIFTGSDEIRVTMPNGSIARGAWRCFDAFGNVIYIMDTMTDEARSSPAIADMDEDGIKEIAAGTTSGWFLEVIEDGEYEWSFPTLSNGPVTGGNYVWHSSPAIVDVNPAVDGMEVIAGDNPHGSVWCFDGDNSDGIDEGITINAGYFPGFPNGLGVEGIEWDVLWVFDTAGRVIASPAVGDIDNDGNMEVVIGDLNGVLYIIDALTGVQEWNFSTGGAIYSSAALADIDNDGLLEIIFGSNDGNVYCLQWNGVTGIQQWSFATGGAVYSSPSIGDINADYEYEIIFGSNDYNVYCLNASGNLLWNVTTGGAVYSSPALADVEIFSYAEEWPMFRGNPFRNGFYPEKGKRLEIFIGSEDNYLYEIDGNGSIVNTFLTNGPIHTSPSVADVDGDGFINILFYDWAREISSVQNDTFWCLERGYKNINFVRVDAIAPQTVKEVVSKDKYNITSSTNIWLNSTDIGNCTVGVKYVHYEIWHDSNKDGVVDTLVESKTVYDNGIDDYNPADGVVSVLLHIVNKGINELRWYAEDYVGNVEVIHTQEHKVIVYAPSLTITKVDSKDPIRPGEFLNYTITVENTGNANATNVIITETYDPNVSFISANPSPTIGNNEWHISLLQPGDTYTIQIKVQVHKPLENNIFLNNSVNVTCDEGETNKTYEKTLVTAPVLVITKESVPATTEPNSTLMYRIRVNNYGLIEANNVVIKDVYDSRVNFISSNPMPTISNNEWHIGVLDAGDSFVIEVYVEVPASVENGSTLVNYVNVTCEEGNYDEAIVYTPVISSPPYTYKKFYGKVINVTVLSDGREYVLHYILNNTTIDLVAVDNGSGIAKTFYRIFKWDDGWKILFNWQIYGVWNPYPPYYPINLAELGEMYNFTPCGKYEIEFYSIDRAGNVEDVRWNDVFVDCFAPSSYITSIAVNNRSVDVFADAEDIGIGVEKIALYYRYSQDNVTWGNWTYYGTCYSNYSWHLSLLPDGYYEFYTLAYDLLGNHEMIPNASTNAKARCIISYPWDINVDGRVNVIDLYFVITHWMETPEDENWDPKVDVNGDEIINVVDIVEIINHWTG